MNSKIPIYTYHDAIQENLAWDLSFLAINNYATLGARELYDIQISNTASPKAVALSFDDARASCASVLAPLLKKYCAKAIVFVAPSLIAEKDEDSRRYCSWRELREMSDAKLIDIQNHSMEHELVFSGPRLIDFQRPDSFGNPLYHCFMPGLTDAGWGAPIFAYAWRGASDNEFIPSRDLIGYCIDFVTVQGGVSFFGRGDWRKLLDRHLAAFPGSHGELCKTTLEREAYIRNSLRASQAIITQKIGITPRFFAAPVHSYDTLVIKVLKEEGFLGLFNGGAPSSVDSDGFVIFGRERGDAPRRLPGKGRETLFSRAARRLRNAIRP